MNTKKMLELAAKAAKISAAIKAALAQEQESTKTTLSRGVNGVCSRSACECEREGLGDQCIWLRPTDAELERRTGLRFTKAGAALNHNDPTPAQQQADTTLCPCGDRSIDSCPGKWEPGCDLGINPKYAVRVWSVFGGSK